MRPRARTRALEQPSWGVAAPTTNGARRGVSAVTQDCVTGRPGSSAALARRAEHPQVGQFRLAPSSGTWPPARPSVTPSQATRAGTSRSLPLSPRAARSLPSSLLAGAGDPRLKPRRNPNSAGQALGADDVTAGSPRPKPDGGLIRVPWPPPACHFRSALSDPLLSLSGVFI